MYHDTDPLHQLTSSPPAFGLGLEAAYPDLMQRPPHSSKEGVFTWPLIMDTMVYGVLMGATCLLNVGWAVIPDLLAKLMFLQVCDRCIRQREWRAFQRL